MPNGHSSIDDIIELYKKDIDISLIKENLKLTPDQRLEKLQRMINFTLEAQKTGKILRQSNSTARSSIK